LATTAIRPRLLDHIIALCTFSPCYSFVQTGHVLGRGSTVSVIGQLFNG